MKRRFPFVALLGLLAVAALACRLTPAPTTEVPDDDQLATIVAATLGAGGGETTTPPPAETGSPAPVTQAPTCSPLHPGAQPPPQANGLAAGLPNTETINFHDMNGAQVGSVQATGISWQDQDQVHFGGGTSGGFAALPVIFHSLANSGEIRSSLGGTVSQALQISDLVALDGAPAQPLISFSSAESGTNGWISRLYATSLANAAGAQPLLTRDEGDGFVHMPLAVRSAGGQIEGVWYTLSLYGIGNIIFQPYRGLYYLDLSTSQVTEYLNFDRVIAGFSPDQTWVAYDLFVQFPRAETSVTLKNLLTCQEVVMQFDSSSDQGGGYVRFSPDNQLVAWLEASGPTPMEAQLRLRVSGIDGSALVNSPAANLASLAGGETPTWIMPEGWIANHLLLVRLNVQASDNPLLVVWAPDPNQPLDPALGANQSALLADGEFLGFTYP